jgi:endoglucanase
MGFFTTSPAMRFLLVIPILLFCCVSGGCRENAWPLWEAYSARFIDQQGRVFDSLDDQRTTSEGQAYALFFSLVANHRTEFDRILNWTQTNLANGDLQRQLPAWLWGRDKDGEGKVLDANSAADADVWIAYTLIEAGRLWKHAPYTSLGSSMLALVAKNEVASLPEFGPTLLPGASGFQHGNKWTLNPSYMPPFLFDRLAEFDSSGPWSQIAVRIPTLLEQSARHGFAMDWVEYLPGDGFYPAAEPRSIGDRNTDGAGGSYDAIRVYLWAGMLDNKNPRRSRILNAVPSMAAYLSHHSAPPERVSENGVPLEKDAPIGFSAALLPYLRAYPGGSKLSGGQLIRIAAQRGTSGLYGKSPAYYDQNLALFSTGFLDGRFRFGLRGELNVEWKLR